MDTRPQQPGTQRPLPPARSVSGSALQFPKLQTRPTLPSRLSNVRSTSQPVNVVDLTSDGVQTEIGNRAAFLANKEKVCSSPDVIYLEDDGDEPPRKRAKTTRQGFRVKRGESDEDEESHDEAYLARPGSPLPSLPVPKASQGKTSIYQMRRSRVGNAARRANGTEPPAIATRLPAPKNVADFSPWTGTHPEDVLNETVVKAGYFDKGVGSNTNESNSAKATIWPNLSQKNNMGLQTLSYLFTQVMEKRQLLGRCTAPSTFKPPPRVTVTDTKREAWLRDLANPDVPLRKQSRTIPHGIRGKLLMDQCLSKDVPLQRAVWLAKCVGANELRAFRRKGVSGSAAASGEFKWIRDWTVNVEQFLEGIITTCGQPDWQRKISYALKMVTSFYAEKLLDASHYLDWIVSSFAAATLERVPAWVLLMRIHWTDLTRYGRRGRRLAESILKRLHTINESNSDANNVLKLRLEKLVTMLAVRNRSCLIIPRTWERYKHLLAPKAANGTENVAGNALQDTYRRNEQLVAPLRKTPANTRSAELDLYTELDAVGLDVDVQVLTTKGIEILRDSVGLVCALLTWAASPYRQGTARVYLAASMISELRQRGNDTDAAVLEFLASEAATTTVLVENVYKVVTELLRRGHFSAGRYMQWLITGGSLASKERPNLASGLLAALQIDSLPRRLSSTRSILMGRLESGMEPTESIETCIAHFEERLHRPAVDLQDFLSLWQTTPMETKAAFNCHVRARLQNVLMDNRITIGSFLIFRHVFERLEDISCLVELLSASSKTDDVGMLATITDTINFHAEALGVLGQLRRLTDTVVTRYRTLRSQQPLDRPFIHALMRLTKRFTDQAILLELLNGDLGVCEQQNSVAVCSPASDSLIGMHAGALDSDEDIEAVFASGNSMDDQLMQRVFLRIMQRAPKPRPAVADSASKVCLRLNQLRALGGANFEVLATNFVQDLLRDAQHVLPATSSIAVLLASDCFSFDTVIQLAKTVGSPSAAAAAMNLLLGSELSPALHEVEKYRYSLMQKLCCNEQALQVAQLLCIACEDPSFKVDNPRVTDLLIQYTFSMPEALKETFKQSCKSEASLTSAERFCQAVVKRGLPSLPEGSPLHPSTLIRVADALSVTFCVGALEYASKTEAFQGAEADEMMQSGLEEAIAGGKYIWPQLIDGVRQPVKKALHDWAQDILLLAEASKPALVQSNHKTVARYLDVLDITRDATADVDDIHVVVLVTDMLKEVEKCLAQGRTSDVLDQQNTCSLNVLLHVCTLHVQAQPSDERSKQARCNLLTALYTLLLHPKVQVQRAVCQYILDLASTLADALPESNVAAVARSAFASSLDKHGLRSIVGSLGIASDTWLGLASQAHPQGTQQQRALQKHQSQQPSSSRPSLMAQSPQQHQQPPQRLWPHLGISRAPVEVKMTPFPVRQWEIMPDAAPVMGENDTSLSLGLFGARKV